MIYCNLPLFPLAKYISKPSSVPSLSVSHGLDEWMSAVSTRPVPLLVKTSLSKVSLVSSEPKNSSFNARARVLVADNEAALPTPRPFALLLKATRKLLLPLLLPTLSSCSMTVLSSVILWRRPLWPLWIGSCPRVRLPAPFRLLFFFSGTFI